MRLDIALILLPLYDTGRYLLVLAHAARRNKHFQLQTESSGEDAEVWDRNRLPARGHLQRPRWAAIACIVTLTGCNSGRIAELERQNRDLSNKVDLLAKSAILDAQEKCAKQARLAFKDLGWPVDEFNGYFSHYSHLLNGCFISATKISDNSLGVYVINAFEGKTYAEYEEEMYTKYDSASFRKWLICDAITSSGNEQKCKSIREFNDLVKPYIEE